MTNYLLSDKLFIQWLDEKKKTMDTIEYLNFINAVPCAQIIYQGFAFESYDPSPNGWMGFANKSKDPVVLSIIENKDSDLIIEILEDFTAYAVKNSSNENIIGSWSAKKIYEKSMECVLSGIEKIKNKNHTV